MKTVFWGVETSGLVDRYRLQGKRIRFYNQGIGAGKYLASTETSIILFRAKRRIPEEDNYRTEVHYGIATR
jgi:hypothetical protein